MGEAAGDWWEAKGEGERRVRLLGVLGCSTKAGRGRRGWLSAVVRSLWGGVGAAVPGSRSPGGGREGKEQGVSLPATETFELDIWVRGVRPCPAKVESNMDLAAGLAGTEVSSPPSKPGPWP